MKKLDFYFKSLKQLTAILLFVLFASATAFSQTGTVYFDFPTLAGGGTDGSDGTSVAILNCNSIITGFTVELTSNNYSHEPYIIQIESPDGTIIEVGDTIHKLGIPFMSPAITEPGGTWTVYVSEPISPVRPTGDAATVKMDYTYIASLGVEARCKDEITVYLDATGLGRTFPNIVDNGSTGCGLTLTIDNNYYGCTDIGTGDVVNLTVIDENLNEATCASNVIVVDNIKPNALCRVTVIYLDETGNASITPEEIDNDSWDGCGVASMSLDITTFDNTNIGVNPVVLTVTDKNGNVQTCTSNVTVNEFIPTEAICKDITVQLDENGEATITAADIDGGSTAIGPLDMSVDQSTFDCTNVGPNTVTLTVTDDLSNTSTCAATVTVEDAVPPVAVCQDITVQLDASGAVTVDPAAVDNISTDACGIASLSLDVTDFNCTDIGTNPVVLTVEDNNGNSETCTATVTVEDVTPPTAVCQDVTVQLDNNGEATIAAADIDNGSSDLCGSVTLAADITQFDCTNVGANTVTLTVTDESNNSSTCASTVTVENNNVPVAVCKAITVQLDENGEASITAANVDGGSSAVCNTNMEVDVTQFDCSNIGANTVTLTVSDNAGNSSTCTSTVTVEDNIEPTVLCKDLTIQLDATGVVTITSGDIDNGSADACGIASLAVNPAQFDCADVGTNTVTLTATDVNGNTGTCTSTVTVEDVTAPTAVCQDITVQLDTNGEATIDAADVDNGSSDLCGNVTLDVDVAQFDCASVGANTVVLTITDESENTSTCTSTVTVENNNIPVAVCKDTSVDLDENGEAMITFEDVDGGSTAVCPDTIMISPSQFDCSNVGANEVTLTINDLHGNSSQCAANVTVNDNTPPQVIAKNIEVCLDDNGSYTLTPEEVDAGTTDNCSIQEMIVTPQDFTCADIGENVVTFMATDANGNSASVTVNVTVKDCVAPIVNCSPLTVYLYENGQYYLTKKNIEFISKGNNETGLTIDNCTPYEEMKIQVFPRSFECVHVGTPVTVTVSATDASGNTGTCKTTVTVLDTISPVVHCKDTVDLYLDENGSARIFAGFLVDKSAGNVDDACSTNNTWASQTRFDCSNVGANVVTLSKTDVSNNTSTCNSVVMVYDTIRPVIEPVADVEMEVEAGVCETAVTYPAFTVTDNCVVTQELIEGLGKDVMFPVGTTTETWVFTDEGGNTDTLSFNVIITGGGNADPTLDSIESVTISDNEMQTVNVPLTGISSGMDCAAQDVTVTATADDTDLVTSITVNYAAGDSTGSLDVAFDAETGGQSDITVTVEDSEGAMVSQTFTLFVVTTENHAPVLVMPIPDLSVDAFEVVNLPVSSTLGVIFNDIDGDTLTFSFMQVNGDALPAWMSIENDVLTGTPELADTGCVSIVIQAADPSGAMASDTFDVCVDYVVGINPIAKSQFEVNLYPNPSQGQVNIDLKSSAIQDIDLSVVDLTGRVVLRKQFSAAERITFDMSNNISGMYLVKLEVGGNLILKKLILDRQ